MSNLKNVKKALFSSVCALFVCFTMLVGTTFAWFTDSVTSSNNKIVTGNLDVALLLDVDGNGYVDISEDTNPIFGEGGLAQNVNAATLWEPGKTQVAYLAIKNAGSLDLKYKVAIDVYGVTGNLHEVMKYAITPDAQYGAVTAWDDAKGVRVAEGLNLTAAQDVALASGAIHYFALSIHMDEEAGNVYMNKSITFDIKVLAGQLASEEDSFGPEYDAEATYPGITVVPAPAAGVSGIEIEVFDEASDKIAVVTIPSDAIAAGTENVAVTVEETELPAGITVATGLEYIAYDVKVSGLVEGNTTDIKVKLRIGGGLNENTIKLYHYSTEITGFTYSYETGLVTFETTSFSPFTIVFDAESQHQGTVPGALPVANVVRSSEHENKDLEWESYGAWSPTEGLDSQLEAAYTFSCAHTSLEEVKASGYADWHCDFYVKLDCDLGENEIFLGGNYGDFGWIGFHNGDFTLEANEEIALLGSVTSNPWTYEEVYSSVRTFICGVGDVNNALSGATFTVMLRLTNPENEAEFYNVATINYTFQ